MFAAIAALLGYDLLESSLLAQQNIDTLTALGFTLPITITMMAIAIGTSIRCNNKVVKFACNKSAKLPEIVTTSLFTSALLIVALASAAALFNQELLALLGNNSWQTSDLLVDKSSITDQQNIYLMVRYLSWIFLGLIWQCNSVLRALGEIRMAGNLMLIWLASKSILAIVLLSPSSPFYQTGLTGITIIHGTTDTLFAMISLRILSKKIPFQTLKLTTILTSLRQPKTDTLMVMTQQLVTPISLAILTIIAGNIDYTYVAAFAILFRIEAILLIIPMVLTTSMPAIIGTNYWSGHANRVKKAYRLVFIGIISIQLLIAISLFYNSNLLAQILCPQAGVYPHLKNYLLWVPWGYAGAGCAIVYQSCLNAKGRTLSATSIAIGHRVLLVIPFTFIGSTFIDDTGLFQGMLFGHLGAGVLVLILFKYRNIKKNCTLLTSKPKNLLLINP